MRVGVFVGCLTSLAIGASGCSFAVGAKNPRDVREKHEIADVVVSGITGFGCALAVIAWASPDSYAPDDGSTWTEQDREDTKATGQLWTPIACTVALGFVASGLYGHFAKRGSEPSNEVPATVILTGAMAGAAATSPPPPSGAASATPATTPASKTCTSDFTCGVGYTCVKKQFASSGFCAKSVDEMGVQTFETPSTDSVGPKLPERTDCQYVTDCPVGFRCDLATGACLK